jgi:hypothetical protein
MQEKKVTKSPKGKKAVESTRSLNRLTTQTPETALTPTTLEAPKNRISLEYARTFMAIGAVAFIVVLVRADVAVVMKICLATLAFMASILTALLGIRR